MSASRTVILFSALLLAASGCASAPAAKRSVAVLDTRVRRERPSTWLGLPLRNGQIVLSEPPGSYSFLFALGPARFFPFTHAAILTMEDGQPWVYDMSGRFKPSFGSSPADWIDGGCRRQPLGAYAAANLYVEIFDPPPGVDADAVAAYVQRAYREDVAFDPYWRYDEHEALFCTELVQLALEAGGYPPVALEPVRSNRSLRILLRWFGVDTTGALPAGRYRDPEHYVGALGRMRSRAEAYAYFEAKREIHRRFSDDQLLGNVFVLEGRADIALRAPVRRFVERARELGAESGLAPGSPELRARVRALADAMFGPVE